MMQALTDINVDLLSLVLPIFRVAHVKIVGSEAPPAYSRDVIRVRIESDRLPPECAARKMVVQPWITTSASREGKKFHHLSEFRVVGPAL